MQPSRRPTRKPQVMVGWQIVFNTDKPESLIAVQRCILFICRFEDCRTFVDLVKHGNIQGARSGLLRRRHLLPEKITLEPRDLVVYLRIVVHIAPAKPGEDQWNIIHNVTRKPSNISKSKETRVGKE